MKSIHSGKAMIGTGPYKWLKYVSGDRVVMAVNDKYWGQKPAFAKVRSNGFGITLHTPNNRYINDERVAQAVAQFLTRGGIPTKFDAMPSAVFFSRGTKLEFSLLLAGWGAETGETSSPLRARGPGVA